MRFAGIFKKYKYIILLMLLCLTAFFIRFLSIINLELSSDEYFDLDIISSLRHNPNPFDYDSSEYKSFQIEQMRFPFYLSLPFFYFYPSIQALRLISIIFAILSIIVAYRFGNEFKDENVGILTALFISISTYHIAFSRFALTASDSIFSFFYILSSLLFLKGMNSKYKNLMYLSAIFAGFAIASKLFGVFLIPIYGYFLLKKIKIDISGIDGISKKPLYLGIFVICTLILNILINEKYLSIKLIFYFVSLISLFLYTILIFKTRVSTNNLGYTAINMLILIISFTFVLSPTHLSIFAISNTFDWFDTWNFQPFLNSRFDNYIKILYIKLHFPINLLFLFGLIKTALNYKDNKDNFLFLSFIIPFIFLSLLNWKLTWHLMFLLPYVYLITADVVLSLKKFLTIKFAYKSLLFFIIVLYIFIEAKILFITHPYYEFDGYQYGLKNIGSDKAAFLSRQKMPEAAKFVNENVPENSTIGFYFTNYGYSNEYNLEFFRRYLDKKYKFISLNSSTTEYEKYDYAILHFYSRDFMNAEKCMLIKTVSHLNINLFYVYKC